MENQEKLKNYIYQQFQAGLHPDEIAQQLRTAGWNETDIAVAFQAVQSTMAPSSPATPTDTLQPGQDQASTGSAAHFEPTGRKRGRIKTAWLLLKQSLRVLRHHKQLLRYPFMGGIISLLLTAIFVVIALAGGDTFYYQGTDVFGDQEAYLTPAGMLLAFVYYVVAFFVIYIYNAGLAAHVLDIFRGKSNDYKYYMKTAWSKRGTIFFYSLITATVGVILHAIEQRFRWIGYFVSRILGAIWSLANLFTIPVIVETDSSAPNAIKQSTQLFLSRWGENVAARITFGGLAFLLYLLLFIPLMIIVFMIGGAFGVPGIVFAFVVMLASIILFATVETAASNILSTALYFYARYQQIPGSFDPELLNAVFVPKKKRRGLFGKKTPKASA